MYRNAPRNAPRRSRTVRNTLACAAVAFPVLLIAGCSSDSDKPAESDKPSASASKSPTVAPAKYKELPDSCKSIAKGAVKDLTPGTDNASGKRVGSGDTNDSNSCLWSGLDKYDYRQLTLSLKRFDSEPAIGSGDKRAAGRSGVKKNGGEGDKEGVKPIRSPRAPPPPPHRGRPAPPAPPGPARPTMAAPGPAWAPAPTRPARGAGAARATHSPEPGPPPGPGSACP
ncbi:hypothetical protein [Streptomyces albus]|uniref:hypothetical protein n=1 Tax=Streptomyces sp. NRRL F-5639 TaxID=1463867 RepID=UPI001F32ADD3|nr:hypothetical protein [Streptomyces sp. NRRL F-5639]